MRLFQRCEVRGRRERYAAARRVVSVDVRDQQPEVLHLLQSAGDLGREEHVAALVDVGGELGHGGGRVERQPVAEPPARQVGDGAHREEVPAHAGPVEDHERGPPSRQHGPVRLGEGSDPGRCLPELQKQPLQRVAELPLHIGPRFREGNRLRQDPRARQFGA